MAGPAEIGKNQTILIVDDEDVILDLTSIILRSRGYQVLTASNGSEGLKVVEASSPELVLLDYMMPGMDGLTALKEIRHRFPETYVIMFTGKGSEEIAVELMKAGASDYILKPFNNQNLIERIESVLRVRAVELKNKELMLERERLLREIESWNRELEARVEEKTEELRKAQAEIIQREKLAALGHLAAGMTHEIRNPLNSIALFTQLLQSGLNDPEKQEYTEKILKEIDRVDIILRKLLDVAKRPKFEISEVSVAAVIDSAVEFFRSQTDTHRIVVEKEFRKVPPAIPADANEIEQIFTNLIVNSIHEMRNGGTLRIELDHDERDLIARVTDTGKGIPKENLAKVFDPFFTTKSSGTGLGLALVLRIVKSYNGRIEVEKSDSTGTTFCIRLPLAGR